MTKRNITKIVTTVGKVAALVAAISQNATLVELLGANAAYGAYAFAGASALKDIVVVIQDLLDDGVINRSAVRNGLRAIALVAVPLGLLTLLSSCVTADGQAVPGTAVQAAPGAAIEVSPFIPADIGREPVLGVLVIKAGDKAIVVTPEK